MKGAATFPCSTSAISIRCTGFSPGSPLRKRLEHRLKAVVPGGALVGTEVIQARGAVRAAIRCDAHDAKRQQQKPHDGVKNQRRQGQRPAGDQDSEQAGGEADRHPGDDLALMGIQQAVALLESGDDPLRPRGVRS